VCACVCESVCASVCVCVFVCTRRLSQGLNFGATTDTKDTYCCAYYFGATVELLLLWNYYENLTVRTPVEFLCHSRSVHDGCV